MDSQIEADESISPPMEKILSFPLDALPKCVKSLVIEASRANCCPPDFIAVPVLAVLGAAIGNSHILQVKSGWTFKANLYGCIIGPAGSAKSSGLKVATLPMIEKQREAERLYREEKKKYQNDLARWERSKGDNPKPTLTPMVELCATDATVESLGVMLQYNPKGVAIIPDELTGWIRGLNQYRGGRGADKEAYLSFWSGGDVKVNRSGKDTVLLASPFLAVCGCIVPSSLNILVDESGEGEDGFIHRILFTFPDSVSQTWTDATISQTSQDAYRQVFENLWKLPPDMKVVILDDAAKSLWIDIYNEIQGERWKDNFPINLHGVWAKLPMQLGKITLILHCAKVASGEATSEKVDVVTMSQAKEILNYFKSHAQRVYKRLQESPVSKKIRLIVEWSRKHEKTFITTRDISRSKIVTDPNEIRGLFEMMEKPFKLGRIEAVKSSHGKNSVKFIFG